jgi:hypothetical protein
MSGATTRADDVDGGGERVAGITAGQVEKGSPMRSVETWPQTSGSARSPGSLEGPRPDRSLEATTVDYSAQR